MLGRQLTSLPVSFAAATIVCSLFSNCLFAQSTSLNLGAKLALTTNYAGFSLGTDVAFSADFIVAAGVAHVSPGGKGPAYIFQRSPAGWVSETPIAVLTSSDGDTTFGDRVAIDGDTVVIGSGDKAYIFVKPVSGWTSMHETAQLTIANGAEHSFGSRVGIVGDTIAVGSSEAAYIFVKPSGGWTSTSTYAAELSPPGHETLATLAFSGDTIAVSFSNRGGIFGPVDVFQEPEAGWATTENPTAVLSASDSGAIYADFGISIAIASNAIAIGSPFASSPYYGGAVYVYSRPAAGWKNAIETAKLYPPITEFQNSNIGYSVALDNEHVITSTTTHQFYVYSKPAAGWASGAWPSQIFVDEPADAGATSPALGNVVGIQGNTIVAAAPDATVNGIGDAGAVYVFPLPAESIEVSSDFLQFPDMNFGNSEVLPLTVTNPTSSTVNFTTFIDTDNFQVLNTNENTCVGGIPAGQSCILPVQFSPPAVGKHTHFLTLSSPSTAGVKIVMLRGFAGGLGAISEAPLTFDIAVGDPPVTDPLVLKNFGVPGSPTVSVSFSNPAFSLASGGTCTTTGVPEGQTCTLTIRFSADVAGEFTGDVILKPTSGATSFAKVQGVAESPDY